MKFMLDTNIVIGCLRRNKALIELVEKNGRGHDLAMWINPDMKNVRRFGSFTNPISISAGSKVEQIRKRASTRCLSASSKKIYSLNSGNSVKRMKWNQAS